MRVLCGAVGLYVVMAACSGSQDAVQHTGSSGGSPMSAGGDATGAGGPTTEREAGFMGGLIDALADPVVEAKAALPPDVATEPCSVSVQVDSGTSYVYAEHPYPGKTMSDLSAIRTIGHYAPGTATKALLPASYENTTNTWTLIKDGGVAVQCGINNTITLDRVTFILPSAI